MEDVSEDDFLITRVKSWKPRINTQPFSSHLIFLRVDAISQIEWAE